MEELKTIGKETAAKNANTKLISFVETLSGGLISNGLGILTDQVENFRLTQALKLRDKLNEELKTRGIRKPKAIRPKILIPLMEEATLEDDDDLQTRYAMLLANACDPNYKGNIQRSFISILRELEPIDAVILNYTRKLMVGDNERELMLFSNVTIGWEPIDISKELGIIKDDINIGIRNLYRLGLLRHFTIGSRDSSVKDTNSFTITEMGVAFVNATQPSEKQSTSSALDELQSMGQEYEAG